MSSNENQSIRMSIDLKKFRFRVHRGTLHALGDPAQVQLMFDPGKKALMLIAPSDNAASFNPNLMQNIEQNFQQSA